MRTCHSITLCALALSLIPGLAQGQPPGGPPPPPEVTFVAIAARAVPISFEYVGVTEASRVVEIRSRIQGFIETRDFEEGALIEKGELLFTIDPRPFEADLEIAKAQVEQAEARLRLAEQEVSRLKSVSVPGAIAKSDLDKQVAEQTNAAAALKLAEAQRDKAALELSYARIEAPLTGLIGKAQKEIGSLVDAGANSLLAEMHRVDPIYVSFQMSEQDYLQLQLDLSEKRLLLPEGKEPYVEIELADGSLYAHRGTPDFVSTTVDRQTGSVEMRATIANPDRILKPGQFITAHLGGWRRPGTIAVPLRAVTQSPQGVFVYVIDAENKATLREITPGPWTDGDWIIESGLSPGERVVVDGLSKVQPGTVVNPMPLPEEAAAAKGDEAPASAAGAAAADESK